MHNFPQYYQVIGLFTKLTIGNTSMNIKHSSAGEMLTSPRRNVFCAKNKQ